MSLGEYLQEKRKEKDMSQRDLANASGVSNAEISRIEAGTRKQPSPKTLRKIAEALNTPLEEVYQQAGIIEKGRQDIERILAEVGDTPISALRSSDFSPASTSYLSVDDLSEEEIADVKQYIAFLKSKRK